MPPGHLPQLDGLRALAVCSVAWSHWAPAHYRFGLPWGAGVQLFFVLSGFLITGLLLDARTQAPARDHRSMFRIWRNFYARRALRLFPVYYAVLAWVTVAGVVSFEHDLGWHLGYATNFYIIRTGCWIGYPSHLWTLAVEEQFYLVWPLVVLALPIRWLPLGLAAVTVSGPLFRAAGSLWFPHVTMLGVATPAQFDALGGGALLAWWLRNPHSGWTWVVRHRVGVALLLAGGYFLTGIGPAPEFSLHAQRVLLNALFFLVVHAAATGTTGPASAWLENGALCYVGRISYGLYLFHNFSDLPASALAHAFPAVGQLPAAYPLLRALSTLALAAASWHWLERPINAWKLHFPYHPRPKVG